ncbi:MAG: 30S ribosomal protein S7 [Acidobacteriota bacterium]
MPRRGKVKKIKIAPDPYYNSHQMTKVINVVMKKGKKSISQNIVYNALKIIKEKTKEDPLKILNKAIENTRPLLETKSRRVGGATYQVPVDVPLGRGNSLAIRWIVKFARERAGKSMEEKIASEIIDASQYRGGAIKKKEDTHKIAESNRAFAHYRW